MVMVTLPLVVIGGHYPILVVAMTSCIIGGRDDHIFHGHDDITISGCEDLTICSRHDL